MTRSTASSPRRSSRTFDEGVQRGLVTLSIAPVIDRQLASELLGDEVGRAVCALAIDIGIMAERGDQLELHPLARSFLDDRAHASTRGATDAAETLRGALPQSERLGRRARPDHAVQSARTPSSDAGRGDGRTARHRRDCPRSRSGASRHSGSDVDKPCVALARAEIAMRRARLTEAQTHGEAAAE